VKARKVGVEEELKLVDPASGLLTGIARQKSFGPRLASSPCLRRDAGQGLTPELEGVPFPQRPWPAVRVVQDEVWR
jgi:hypothetical protein